MTLEHRQVERLLDVFMAGKSANTRKTYRADLSHFASFMQADTTAAVQTLLSAGNGGAYEYARLYQQHLRACCASATANRRISVLRSLCETASSTNHISWLLRIKNLPAKPLRDTLGPGRENIRAMLKMARRAGGGKSARDAAIIYMFYGLALRRGEVVELDAENIDLERPAVSILGKGQTERQWVTMSLEVQEAIAEWLTWRGDWDGPLFVNYSRAHGKKRISSGGMNYIIGQLGDAIGCRATPHGLRHTAITTAIQLGYTLPDAQKFSRHRHLETLQVYYDAVMDVASDISAKIVRGLE